MEGRARPERPQHCGPAAGLWRLSDRPRERPSDWEERALDLELERFLGLHASTRAAHIECTHFRKPAIK